MTFCLLTSTFRASMRPSFLLPFCASAGPFVNVPCVSEIFRQHSVWPRAFHKLPSIFYAPAVLSVRFCLLSVIPRDHNPGSIRLRDFPSNVRTSVGPSVNFHQLSVHLRDLLSASVNFSCISGTFSQLSVPPWYLPSTSVNILCICGTSQKVLCICWSFRQLQTLPGSFRIIFQLFVHPRGLQSTFCAAVGPSVNFSQLFMPPWGLRTTFHVSVGLFVNIPCGWKTIRQLFLCRGTLHQRFVNFLCVHVTLRQFYMRP